jgi:hypothetical protein
VRSNTGKPRFELPRFSRPNARRSLFDLGCGCLRSLRTDTPKRSGSNLPRRAIWHQVFWGFRQKSSSPWGIEKGNRRSLAAHFMSLENHIEEMIEREPCRARLRRGVGPVPARVFEGILADSSISRRANALRAIVVARRLRSNQAESVESHRSKGRGNS